MLAYACEKRDQLVTDGYAVIPEVFGEELLQVFRDWSEDYFSQHEVEHRYRYQGSDVAVVSPARWSCGDIPTPRSGDKSERILPDPIVDQYLNDPGLQMACRTCNSKISSPPRFCSCFLSQHMGLRCTGTRIS
jgi:hypothetical protein